MSQAANFVAWSLFILGIAHVLYGFVKFRQPLLEGIRDGFVGQFSKSDSKRAAFWFVMFGPLLMLAGHLCIQAVAKGDFDVISLVGTYLFVVSVIGVVALPKSPFIAGLMLSLLVMAVGYQMI